MSITKSPSDTLTKTVVGGEEFSRQFSKSLQQPSCFAQYMNAVCVCESGWLDYLPRGAPRGAWTKRFFVFDNDGIRHAEDRNGHFVVISMKDVVSFRSNKVEAFMTVTTTSGRFLLRASSLEELHTKWLFALQKSVALVWADILDNPHVHKTARKVSDDDGCDGFNIDDDDGEGPTWKDVEENTIAPPHADLYFGERFPVPAKPRRLSEFDDSFSPFTRQRSLGDCGDGNWFADAAAACSSSMSIPQPNSKSPNNSNSLSPVIKIMATSPAIPIPIPIGADTSQSGFDNFECSPGSYYPPAVSNSISGFASGKSAGIGFNSDADTIGMSAGLLLPVSGGSEGGKISESFKPSAGFGTAATSDASTTASITINNGCGVLANTEPYAVFANSLSKQIQEASMTAGFGQEPGSNIASGECNGTNGTNASYESPFVAMPYSQPQASTGQEPPPARESRAKGANGPQKEQHALGTLHWNCGQCSRRGAREHNDDRLVVITNFEELIEQMKAQDMCGGIDEVGNLESGEVDVNKYGEVLRAGRLLRNSSCADVCHSFYAIYDGHGGCQAAQYLTNCLHFMIARHPDFRCDLNNALHQCCLLADKNFLDICAEKKEKGSKSGTTALGAILRGHTLTIFNIGDCMAVLKRNDKAIRLVTGHTPDKEDEQNRILAAGGWITEEVETYVNKMYKMEFEDPIKQKMHKVNLKDSYLQSTNYRVMSEIGVSRSIGDREYKRLTVGEKLDDFAFLWPIGHNQILHDANLLIADPEIAAYDISPMDEFLILACDGVWDVMSIDEAVVQVTDSLKAHSSHHDDKTASTIAAEDLCRFAIGLGSGDNVTALVIQFIHSI